MDVVLIPARDDNYIHLIPTPDGTAAIIVDPCDAAPVARALTARGWGVAAILNTHHHGDHVGGNLDLKAAYGAPVIGPAADRDRIPGIDRAIADGEVFTVAGIDLTGIHVPGHTRGHIAFHAPGLRAVFTGDTLFSLGCGRLFEGTPAQMWASLCALRALPDDTLVYCGHEYTAGNGRYALTVDPDNADLRARMAAVADLRAAGRPTLPTTIGQEKRTNPFLRADLPPLAAAVGLPSGDPVAVFAALRLGKDHFRG